MALNKYLKGFLILCVLLLIFSKYMLVYVIITSYVPIQINYSLDNTQLGLIITIYYITSLIGSLNWTYLFQIWSKLKILTIGGICWILGMIIIAINQSYWQLLVGCAISGFGAEASFIITINYFVEIISENQRGKAFSIYFIAQGAGGILGNVIAGIAEGMYFYSWRLVIAGITIWAGFSLAIVILFLRKFAHTLVPENPISNPQMPEVNMTLQIMKEKINLKQIKEVFTNKVNLFLIIFLILYLPTQYFNVNWLQKYWINIHSLSQISASISFTFTSGAEFLGYFISGFIVDYFAKKKKINIPKIGILALLVSSPFLFIGYLIPWNSTLNIPSGVSYIQICWAMFMNALETPPVFASYVMLFLGFFIIHLMGAQFLNIVVDYNTERLRPLVINMCIILLDIGLLIGPILGGFIADISDFEVLLLIVPIIYLICGLVYIGIYEACKQSVKN